MSEVRESLGRIEVAPEVLGTIAYFATLKVEGVAKMAAVPADVTRLLRRGTRHDGLILDLSDDKVKFDIYVIMNRDVNVMETSRAIQKAVAEAMDTMVDIPIDAINIHVEDVVGI
ncbi:MAG: Asp23/Gls24 family envelope stress response protein [Anaerolineales bacterium]|nr:Asp23/Gls24 family envelope stress response protein [Anaerolineales bacterium]